MSTDGKTGFVEIWREKFEDAELGEIAFFLIAVSVIIALLPLAFVFIVDIILSILGKCQ